LGLHCYKVNDNDLVVVMLLLVMIDDGVPSLHESEDAKCSVRSSVECAQNCYEYKSSPAKQGQETGT
jgi:hypothetical protein